MNIINQKVKHRNGEVYTITGFAQSLDLQDCRISLSNGKVYAYIQMFKNGAFKLQDQDLNNKVLAEIAEYEKKVDVNQAVAEYEREVKEEYDRVMQLYYSNMQGCIISNEHCKKFDVSDGFIYNRQYGRNSLEIYQNGIRYLNFNPRKIDQFGMRTLCYAQNCTPEGYSVWILPYSSLNGRSNRKWVNFIEFEHNKIVQYSFDRSEFTHPPLEKRLTFAKQQNNEYVFLGIYKLSERIPEYFDGQCESKEIYTLVSRNYPENL